MLTSNLLGVWVKVKVSSSKSHEITPVGLWVKVKVSSSKSHEITPVGVMSEGKVNSSSNLAVTLDVLGIVLAVKGQYLWGSRGLYWQ